MKMNEKQEILSAAERQALEIKAKFYEDLGFAPMVVANLKAQLAADDLARLQMEATTRQ
jgi:hypothetical protein